MAHSKDYIFGDKREQASFATAGPACRAYHDYLLSDEFAGVVSTITGRKLFMDASFHGGGLHTEAPTSPDLSLPRVKARLYFGHAVEDKSMPPEAMRIYGPGKADTASLSSNAAR